MAAMFYPRIHSMKEFDALTLRVDIIRYSGKEILILVESAWRWVVNACRLDPVDSYM